MEEWNNDLARIGAMITELDGHNVRFDSFSRHFFSPPKIHISREIWNNFEEPEGRNVISSKRSEYRTGSDLEAGTGSGIPVIGKSGNTSLRRFDIGIPGRV